MSAQKKLDLLLQWFNDNKIEWDKEALEIKEINGSFGVYAKKNIKKDKTVVKIPKECILSIKTSGIANILDEANLEGGCPLALAVLYEIAQKEQSPWYGYLQALPDQGEDLPIFWSEEEKALFDGTEMESAVRNDLGDLEEDYAELIIPLLEEHPYIFDRGVDPEQGPYSFDKFLKISTLISSRAFEVDAYHENALVPFADIFNHRGENEHVHFETEFEVCDACGALEYCEHQFLQYMDDSDAEEGEEGEEEWEDEDVEDMSDAKEEEDDDDEEMDTELPDLEELEAAGVDFYEEEKEEDKKDTCDMVLDRDVKKGEEVFNTYGEHPNINLLSKYGFCYDDNKNDYISISEDTIVDCVLAVYAENLKEEKPKASEEELEKLAVEKTRPRWEFFLENEHILCPSEEGEEEQRDDYEDDGCQDGCCGPDDDHEHGHHHEDEEEEHEHDEGGGCCGDEDDKAGKSRPYFVNYEGLFEDKLMCLLHVMFVSEAKFAKFVEDMNNALDYFEELANSQGEKKTKAMIDTKRSIYQVCRALVEIRRMDYLENGEWKTIEQEVQEREKVADNKRKYYAFTCRISEKKIIEKAIQYYGDLVKEYTSATPTSSGNKKKPVSKKNKKMKL